MPLIDEHGSWFALDPVRIGGEQLALSSLAEAEHGGGSTAAGDSLADPLGPLQRDCGQVWHQGVELVVDDPAAVDHVPKLSCTFCLAGSVAEPHGREYLYRPPTPGADRYQAQVDKARGELGTEAF